MSIISNKPFTFAMVVFDKLDCSCCTVTTAKNKHMLSLVISDTTRLICGHMTVLLLWGILTMGIYSDNLYRVQGAKINSFKIYYKTASLLNMGLERVRHSFELTERLF